MPTPIVAANICSVNLFGFFGVGVKVYLQNCGGLLYYSIGLYQTPPMKSPQQPSQHGVFYRLRKLQFERLHRILRYFSHSPFISLCYIQLQQSPSFAFSILSERISQQADHSRRNLSRDR